MENLQSNGSMYICTQKGSKQNVPSLFALKFPFILLCREASYGIVSQRYHTKKWHLCREENGILRLKMQY